MAGEKFMRALSFLQVQIISVKTSSVEFGDPGLHQAQNSVLENVSPN